MSSRDAEHLVPPGPQSKGRAGSSSSGSDADRESSTGASRPTSPKNVSYADSPPVTPRALTFSTPVNPFSPPASPSNSFKHGNLPAGHNVQNSVSSTGYFPDRSGAHSRSTSSGDLYRMRNGSSRGGTSEYRMSPNASFHRLRESFTPPPTRPFTIYSSAARLSKVQKERLKSTMLPEDTVLEKPWAKERDSSLRIAYFLTYFFIFFGLVMGGVKAFFTWRAVQIIEPSQLCLVMEENFDSYDHALGSDGTFSREVDMSGFGNGEFEMTTDSQNNSYVSNGNLYITPTFTSDMIGNGAVENNTVFNITGCTYNETHSYTQISQSAIDPSTGKESTTSKFDPDAYNRACSAVSNSTLGVIINPIQTARLSTRKSASIKYGRVEAKAKLPRGDWLWPAIWMLPVNNTYGPWPISGEIDIMESRGNSPDYPHQGVNYVRGTLNWGPATWLNAGWKTFGWWPLRRGTYADDFHTYAVEWDDKFIRIYVDNRLRRMLDLNFNIPFWTRGKFPGVVQSGGEAFVISDPWANSTNAAPFDQPFYLILSLGVGGTNGWFPDGKEKPWLDNSKTAMSDFWRAKDQWLPTWGNKVEDKSFVIDYVKMWKKC